MMFRGSSNIIYLKFVCYLFFNFIMQCGFFAAAVTAEIIDFKSDLPILCVPNSTCWVVNYVDNDFGPNVADYQCGGLSYNGHKGTDFAIRTLKEMRNGIPVLSVSKGISAHLLKDSSKRRRSKA